MTTGLARIGRESRPKSVALACLSVFTRALIYSQPTTTGGRAGGRAGDFRDFASTRIRDEYSNCPDGLRRAPAHKIHVRAYAPARVDRVLILTFCPSPHPHPVYTCACRLLARSSSCARARSCVSFSLTARSRDPSRGNEKKTRS
jgi:hypothetical protein